MVIEYSIYVATSKNQYYPCQYDISFFFLSLLFTQMITYI